jgi:hypothetical protein
MAFVIQPPSDVLVKMATQVAIAHYARARKDCLGSHTLVHRMLLIIQWQNAVTWVCAIGQLANAYAMKGSLEVRVSTWDAVGKVNHGSHVLDMALV